MPPGYHPAPFLPDKDVSFFNSDLPPNTMIVVSSNDLQSHAVAARNNSGAIGYLGTADCKGVRGALIQNGNKVASGFIGGCDPAFKQHAGVYGESDQQGVIGHATTDAGTGVFGNSKGGGFGVRGETDTGVAVQGESFGAGLAGKFKGNVDFEGDLNVSGIIKMGG